MANRVKTMQDSNGRVLPDLIVDGQLNEETPENRRIGGIFGQTTDFDHQHYHRGHRHR